METISSEMIPFFVLLKFLKPLAVILALFLSVSFCSKNDLGCELINSDINSPMSYSRDGDVIIAAILRIFLLHDQNMVDYLERPSADFCIGTSYEYLKHFLAFIYAIEEINSSTDILPNITLGFQIYDSCTSDNLAVKSALIIISETQDMVPNYICQKRQKTIAVVGHFLSSSTYTIAQIAHLYGYPQITYGALNSMLSENFPLLYRTVPNELSRFHAMIQLLIHFGWTLVGIITTEDDSSQQASVELEKQMKKHGICVAFITFISKDTKKYRDYFSQAIKKIKTSSVNVILFYGTEIPLVGFLETWGTYITGKVWITAVEVEGTIKEKCSNFVQNFNGSLAITVQKRKILGFKNFLFRATLINVKDNIFIKNFWRFSFGCYDIYGKLRAEQICENNTMWEDLVLQDTHLYGPSYAIYNAIQLLSEALHQMHLTKLFLEPSSLHLMNKLKPKLNHYLKNVSVKEPSGAKIFFNDKRYVDGNFDVLNFVASSNLKTTNVLVGSWLPSSSNQLQINQSTIVWNPYFKETPRSFCTDPCSPGYRQSLETGKLSCCFNCVQCNDGEITNGTTMESCETCPDDQWSNPTRDKCIQRSLHFLSYEEDLGMSLAVIATILFGFTSSVLWVFIKYRNTPLVRANNCNLSYTLLVSLMICFLLSFLFIGHPEELTCLIRQMSFGFIFAVAISSVLGKTITVLVAFNATKPGSKFKKCVGSRFSSGLVILCSLGELVICVTWLICAPPFIELDTKTIPGAIIVQCNEGSIFAFYVAVSYIGVLAVFSFIVAFISRKLPDTFNEAQYITFSMLVFCSVWMTFIPTYLCTKGKYMVAVEIFAILASNGALLCFIFFPKCYIILLKPKRNTKGEITVKAYGM